MTAIALANLAKTENVQAAPLSPVKGKTSAGDARKAEIKKAAVEFQALFVEMMLKSMRETAQQDKLTGGGHGEEVYGSLLDREYATAISRRGNIGLAEMIERQLLDREYGGETAVNKIGSVMTDNSKIEASHEN